MAFRVLSSVTAGKEGKFFPLYIHSALPERIPGGMQDGKICLMPCKGAMQRTTPRRHHRAYLRGLPGKRLCTRFAGGYQLALWTLLAVVLAVWTLPYFGIVEHAHPHTGLHLHAYREMLQLLAEAERHPHSQHSHNHERPPSAKVFWADASSDALHGHLYDNSLLTLAPIRHALLLLEEVVLLICVPVLAPPGPLALTLQARAPPAFLHAVSPIPFTLVSL